MHTTKPNRSALFWAVTAIELAVVLWAVGLMTWVQPDGADADARLAQAAQAQVLPQSR